MVPRARANPWSRYLNGADGHEAFRAEVLRLPDGRSVAQGFERDPWLREMLAAVDDPLCQVFFADGTRGSGKTTSISWIAVERLALRSSHDVLVFANDKDQAKILLREAARFVKRSPLLAKILDVQAGGIVNRTNGSRMEVLAADAASNFGFGIRPFTAILDEFCYAPNRDLWDALFTALPKSSGSQVIILTNAGPTRDCVAYEVREMCRKSTEPAFRFFSTAAASVVPSWISKDEIEQQRRSLPDSVFARLWAGAWGCGDGGFLSREEVEACIDPRLDAASMKFAADRNYFIGIDLGLKHDRSAIVVLHKERETYVVDHIETWFGTPENPVSLEAVQSYLHMLGKRIRRLRRVFVDPWQGMLLMERAKRAGVRGIEEFTFTVQNVQLLSQSLWHAIRSRNVRMPAYALLVEELVQAKVVERRYGWRVDHRSGGFSDHLIALGMAIVAAMPDKGVLVTEDHQLSQLIDYWGKRVTSRRRFGLGSDSGLMTVAMNPEDRHRPRDLRAEIRLLQVLRRADRISDVEADTMLSEIREASHGRDILGTARRNIRNDCDPDLDRLLGASVAEVYKHGFDQPGGATEEEMNNAAN